LLVIAVASQRLLSQSSNSFWGRSGNLPLFYIKLLVYLQILLQYNI
jgi:hypothetical protein